MEKEFWQVLKDLAAERGTSVSALIRLIDSQIIPSQPMASRNLSSAVRVYILNALKLKLGLDL